MSTSEAHSAGQFDAVFRACLAEAAQAGGALMGRMVASARQSLQMRDNSARDFHERNAVSHALHLLNRSEAQLVQRFPQALEAAFADALSTVKAKAGGSALALSFDQLELMDESQVQDKVEQARAQQAALHAANEELAELTPLICAAQGLKTVNPDRNPMRPDTYVKALQDTLVQTTPNAGVRAAWMQHMCAALGKDLGGTYLHTADRLRAAGVRAAGYAVVQSNDAGGAARAAAAAAHREADAEAQAEEAEWQAYEQELLTVDRLRSLLAGQLDGEADGVQAPAAPPSRAGRLGGGAAAQPAGDFDATVPAALDALQQMDQIDMAMERLAGRRQAMTAAAQLTRSGPLTRPAPAARGGPPTRTSAPESVQGQLRQNARGVSQALSLEVVGLMVENIAQDPRLLPPVQKAVRDIEPALMRLAMIDPRFFSDKEHPARRLLDEITQRSLAYETVDASGFGGFLRPLQLAVRQLSASAIESAEPFEAALDALEQVWDDRSAEDRARREKAVKALLHAEQRNLLAERIRKDILAWPDTARVPAEIREFASGPWAQVIAQARLADSTGASDPGGYSTLVARMLWSAQPALARNNTSKLTRLIPPLLAKLREGLKTIDYPPTQASPFFERLIGLHQQALEAAARSEAAAQPAAGADDWRVGVRPQASANRVQPAAEAGPWLAPEEAKESGFMEAADAFPAEKPRTAVPAAAAGQPELALGSWVELLNDGQWARTQLTWASPHGTLFLFTSASGSTQSMTKRLLDKLLAEGGIRVVAMQPVVDGALDAVAQTAMRNSVDTKL